MMMIRLFWVEWMKVAGKLEKIVWLYRICIPYKYIYVNEIKEDAKCVE
jgi:hypothetical protein